LVDYRYSGSVFEGSSPNYFASHLDVFSTDRVHLLAAGSAEMVNILVDQMKSLSSNGAYQVVLHFIQDPGQAFSWNGSQGSLAVTGGVLSAIDPSASGLTRTAVFTPSLGAYAKLEIPSITYSAEFLQNHSSLINEPSALQMDIAFDFDEAIIMDNAGVYQEDDVLTIGVVLNETYDMDFDFSSMTLDVNIGGATRLFKFDSVFDPLSLGYDANQSVLAFKYQVGASDWDINGIAIKAAHGVFDAAGHAWVVGAEQVISGNYQVLG